MIRAVKIYNGPQDADLALLWAVCHSRANRQAICVQNLTTLASSVPAIRLEHPNLKMGHVIMTTPLHG